MQVIKQLPESKIAEIVDYINQHLKPLAEAEKAKCAKGRLQFWLKAEPNYASRKYAPAHDDERLWAFIRHIDNRAALAQIYFADGNIGIDWHRDAAYAAPPAHIINLGRVILESLDNDDNLTRLELKGGEVIRFNSKHRHRAIATDPTRIGIGIWRDKIPMNDPANWQ